MPPSKNLLAATLAKGQAAQSGVIVADSQEEVAKLVAANSKKLFGFTRKLIPTDLPDEPKLFIYSVSEYGEQVNLGPGFAIYEVHACPVNEEYGEPCVILPINFFEEAKVDQTEHTFTSGKQIADAILKIGPGMNASWDRRRVGWFVSNTNPPSEEEVSRAKELYTAECKRLLTEGNSFASRNLLLEITETHRRAANWLKQKVDWSKPQIQMTECPGCGENVRKGVIWHAYPQGCGYIFNRGAYEENFAPRTPLVRTTHIPKQE